MSTPAEARSATVLAEIAKERAAIADKTERLRALRLAKESEERSRAAISGSATARRKRRAAVKMVRVNVSG